MTWVVESAVPTLTPSGSLQSTCSSFAVHRLRHLALRSSPIAEAQGRFTPWTMKSDHGRWPPLPPQNLLTMSLDNVGLKKFVFETLNSMITLTFFHWCKPKWS